MVEVRIATPVSVLFDRDEDAARIMDVSDCLEGRDEYEQLRLPGQELFHFKASLIWEWNEETRRFIQNAVENRPELELATFHLDSCYLDPPVSDRWFRPSDKLYTREELLANAEANTAWLRSVLPEAVSIGVENNNYFPTPAYEIVTDGDFITDVAASNDLCLLLDKAHSEITAHNKGLAWQTYIDSLPMDRAVQMHLTKPRISERSVVDAHDLPDEDTYREALELVRKHDIRYVGFEYYGEVDGLVAGISRFKHLAEAA